MESQYSLRNYLGQRKYILFYNLYIHRNIYPIIDIHQFTKYIRTVKIMSFLHNLSNYLYSLQYFFNIYSLFTLHEITFFALRYLDNFLWNGWIFIHTFIHSIILLKISYFWMSILCKYIILFNVIGFKSMIVF